ncbi:MAG: hypothetical protein ACLQVN_15870 [Bryobacteraceae bacterium]
MFRFAFVLMICVSARGFQRETGPTVSDREKDVYAIYSLMLTSPQTSHGPDDNERYLIAATTARGQPQQPCVQPPKEREADFRETLNDYERRKDTPRQLRRWLSIPKPYVLLNADGIREFMAARSAPGNGSTAALDRFRGVTDVFTLADVYFNQRRTLALTAISSWCGTLCALYQWKVFEKSDTGKWEERQWVGCATIATGTRRSSPSSRIPAALYARSHPLRRRAVYSPGHHLRFDARPEVGNTDDLRLEYNN